MKTPSKQRATPIGIFAIVVALGVTSVPAWADSPGKTLTEAIAQVFAVADVPGVQALRDDEMGEIRGGFLGGLLGVLDALPDTNTVVIQDGDVTVSDSGPGPRSVSRSRPGFSASASANSSSSSATTISRSFSRLTVR